MWGQDMFSNKKGKYILYCMFLSYFLIYAVSPLSGTFPLINVASNNGIPDNASSAMNKVNIFFWDLVCSKLSCKDTDSPVRADVRLFMRKARAILPDDMTRVITPIEQDVSTSSKDLHNLPYSFPRIAIFLDDQRPITLFNNLYSGHSPPAA